MTRRPLTLGFWRGRLPHWEVEDGRYFVTIHLAGAIPKQGIERIQQLSAELQQGESPNSVESQLPLMRTIFRQMEEWLDRAEHNTLLNAPAVAEMVIEAIQHRSQIQHWELFGFVIMPNHVHLFLSVLQGTLKESIDDFKRWTGHKAAKLISLPNDRFWQDEWFDHWSRSDEQDERIVRYIQQNPVKAGLVPAAADWKYGSGSQPKILPGRQDLLQDRM